MSLLLPFPFQAKSFICWRIWLHIYFWFLIFTPIRSLYQRELFLILLVPEKFMYPDSSQDFKFRSNSASVSLNTFKNWYLIQFLLVCCLLTSQIQKGLCFLFPYAVNLVSGILVCVQASSMLYKPFLQSLVLSSNLFFSKVKTTV